MTTMTKKEELLIVILKHMKVNREDTLEILTMLYQNETQMDKLVEYIKHNQQVTPEEIKAKAISLSKIT